MTKNNLYSQLSDNFEKLGLMQMKLHLDEIADDITSNKISITEGLLKLSNYEIDFKSKSAASSLVKAAAFPFIKELKDFDYDFQPSINQQKMMELENLHFLEKVKTLYSWVQVELVKHILQLQLELQLQNSVTVLIS